MSTLYHKEKLRPHEYRQFRKRLGGVYSILDMIAHGPPGSPLFEYKGGHTEVDELNERCSDRLRINLELLKKGMFIWIAERTRSYFFCPEYGKFFVETINNPHEVSIRIHLADGQFLELMTDKRNKKAWDRFKSKVNRMNKN